jgi:hypothetical protein
VSGSRQRARNAATQGGEARAVGGGQVGPACQHPIPTGLGGYMGQLSSALGPIPPPAQTFYFFYFDFFLSNFSFPIQIQILFTVHISTLYASHITPA